MSIVSVFCKCLLRVCIVSVYCVYCISLREVENFVLIMSVASTVRRNPQHFRFICAAYRSRDGKGIYIHTYIYIYICDGSKVTKLLYKAQVCSVAACSMLFAAADLLQVSIVSVYCRYPL